jgi:hypothetical protein
MGKKDPRVDAFIANAAPTRDKRLATTVEWLAEGKRRNWKYENC